MTNVKEIQWGGLVIGEQMRIESQNKYIKEWMGGVKEEDQQVADVTLRKEASENCKEQKVLYEAE